MGEGIHAKEESYTFSMFTNNSPYKVREEANSDMWFTFLNGEK